MRAVIAPAWALGIKRTEVDGDWGGGGEVLLLLLVEEEEEE